MILEDEIYIHFVLIYTSLDVRLYAFLTDLIAIKSQGDRFQWYNKFAIVSFALHLRAGKEWGFLPH